MNAEMETAAALLRSETPIRILERLDEAAATKYELRDELDCARTTVDRNLDRLEADGWVVESENRYVITTGGEIVLEQASTFLETVGVASRLQPVLRWLPREVLDIDLKHFADAEVTVPTDGQPIAMVDKHTQAVKRASDARLVLPVVSPQGLQAQYENHSLEDLSVEVIATPTVTDILQSAPEFADAITEMQEAGALDIYVTEQSLPCYLGLLDETVQIGVDNDGQPRALLESDDEAVRAWAAEKIESYRADAVPLDAWRERE